MNFAPDSRGRGTFASPPAPASTTTRPGSWTRCGCPGWGASRAPAAGDAYCRGFIDQVEWNLEMGSDLNPIMAN